MANGANRLFKVIKQTGEGTNGTPSQVVSLIIKSLNPLIFMRDDRLEIPSEFCVLHKSLNINNFQINDIVTAIVLNNGLQYLILYNNTEEEQEINYEDLTNKPRINNITLIGNKTSSDLNLDNYNNMQNKPQINGVELSGNKSAADLSLVNTSTLQQIVTNLENQINDKNIITAGISSNVTISTAGANLINLNQTKASVGSKLTLSNGKIAIGAGVNHVLISGQGQMNIQTGNGDAKNFYIQKNGTDIIENLNTIVRSYVLNITRGIGSFLLSVSQGDLISYEIYAGVGDVITASGNYITVEVVK